MSEIKELEELPRCKICGATVPVGKDLCWCCEHTSKLHNPNIIPALSIRKKDETIS